MPQDDERDNLGDQQSDEQRSLTIWAVYKSQYQTNREPKESRPETSREWQCRETYVVSGEPRFRSEDKLHGIEKCAN